MEAQELQNPADKYPKPPYKKQSQPWPGLASQMDPRPDHGEKSYRGSGRLAGRKELITGGDSGMGRAAALAYAREGADVAINYFPTEEPDAKGSYRGPHRVTIPGDLRDEKFCQELVARAIEDLRSLNIIVSNAGRQQTRTLAFVELSVRTWIMLRAKPGNHWKQCAKPQVLYEVLTLNCRHCL